MLSRSHISLTVALNSFVRALAFTQAPSLRLSNSTISRQPLFSRSCLFGHQPGGGCDVRPLGHPVCHGRADGAGVAGPVCAAAGLPASGCSKATTACRFRPKPAGRLRAEGRYPLDVAWDGILVDDPEHPLDLERRVHAALAVLWGDRADALEHEACALLSVPTLREWFRRPAGFFADHLKRYSKSRRQAPIYWPLSTASAATLSGSTTTASPIRRFTPHWPTSWTRS